MLCIVQRNIEILTFGDIEIGKHKFHHSKPPTEINNIDIDKVYFGETCFQYLIGYKEDDKFKRLFMMLPKTNVYAKSFLMKVNTFQF